MWQTPWKLLAPSIRASSLEAQRFLAGQTSSAVRTALPANIPDFRSFLKARVLGGTNLDASIPGGRRVYIETYGWYPAPLLPCLLHCMAAT